MGGESSSDLRILRTLHSIDIEEFCGLRALAHWAEWEHKHERQSSLLAQMHATIHGNWQRFIRPGSIVIDIGAYSGDTAIPMGILAYDRKNGRPGTVIAVEPNPDVYAVLLINLKLNSFLADFHPIAAAVAPPGVAEVEIADLGTSNCNMGIISEQFSGPLKDRLHEVTLNTFKVKGMSLSDIIRSHVPQDRISDISFIKIDCEGFDKEILSSSREVLSVVRPAIFTEWFALFNEEDSRELFRVVSEIGYVALDPATLLEASVDRKISDLMLVPAERMGLF